MASQSFIDRTLFSSSANVAASFSLHGVRALLVDDDLDQLAMLSQALVTAGAAVDTASSAHEAVQALTRSIPDVIVSDIHMPDCDGYHLLRMVRARPMLQGGATPAIALTGNTTPVGRTRALLAGYEVHLAKPIRIIELLVAIRNIIDDRPSPK